VQGWTEILLTTGNMDKDIHDVVTPRETNIRSRKMELLWHKLYAKCKKTEFEN